ncbi:MAG TPA: PDZ domain-containing protein [Candidatus Binataceae bacterium]|nr:PDZ domain-containing protein [Candidatus Binataceae bacterium]
MAVRVATLAVTLCAIAAALAANLYAQSGPAETPVAHPGQTLPQVRTSTGNGKDNSLVIAPRVGAPGPAPAASPATADNGSEPGTLENSPEPELPAIPTSGPPASMVASNPEPVRPYLGIAVQRVESHATPGRDIEGLEIVSVDLDSPAEHAGLKGRGEMTELGATGATAGALMAPLNLVVMPLLNKTGQLGQTGDLIVAIDDRRVTGEVDLQTALENSKPGDTIYFTVVRLGENGTKKTLKIPVKLASPEQQSAGVASAHAAGPGVDPSGAH